MISRWLTTLLRSASPGRPTRTAPPRTFLKLEGLEGREMLSTVSVDAPGWWSPTNATGFIETRTVVFGDATEGLPDVVHLQFGPQSSIRFLEYNSYFALSVSQLPTATPPAVPAPVVPAGADAVNGATAGNGATTGNGAPAENAAMPPEIFRAAAGWVVHISGRVASFAMNAYNYGDGGVVTVAPAPAPASPAMRFGDSSPPPPAPEAPLPRPAARVAFSPTPAPAPTPTPASAPIVARGAPEVGGTAPAAVAPAATPVAGRATPTLPDAPVGSAPATSAGTPPRPVVPITVVADVARVASPRESLAAQTDAALVRRFVGAGEQAAFTELVRRYGPAIQATCARVLGDADRARDAAQATFIALARRAHALDDRGSLAGWLHQVARRMSLRHRATAARHRKLERVAAELREDPDDTLMVVEDQDLLWVLREELARLPEKYRIPLTLCYLDGRTHAEVAQVVGLPRGSVAKRIGEGLARLRDGLTTRGVGP